MAYFVKVIITIAFMWYYGAVLVSDGNTLVTLLENDYHSYFVQTSSKTKCIMVKT